MEGACACVGVRVRREIGGIQLRYERERLERRNPERKRGTPQLERKGEKGQINNNLSAIANPPSQ